jgi:Ca-activated chloride channel family protein
MSKPMEKRYFVIAVLLLGLLLSAFRTRAQQDSTRLRVVVNLVQLNVAVTDNKGQYVTGLDPSDFVITEDGIPENIATFEEGNGPTTRLAEVTADAGKNGAAEPAPAPQARQQDSASGSSLEDPTETLSAAVGGANVFILFDTSNYMYRGFVFAQDAIANFVRSLETADKVAFYSYSRDL